LRVFLLTVALFTLSVSAHRFASLPLPFLPRSTSSSTPYLYNADPPDHRSVCTHFWSPHQPLGEIVFAFITRDPSAMPHWSINQATQPTPSNSSTTIHLCRRGGRLSTIGAVATNPSIGMENQYAPLFSMLIALPDMVLVHWDDGVQHPIVASSAPVHKAECRDSIAPNVSPDWLHSRQVLVDRDPNILGVGDGAPMGEVCENGTVVPLLMKVSVEAFTGCSQSVDAVAGFQLETKISCRRPRSGQLFPHVASANTILYLPYVVSSFALRSTNALSDVRRPHLHQDDPRWSTRPYFAAFMASYCVGRGDRIVRVFFTHLLGRLGEAHWLSYGCRPFGPSPEMANVSVPMRRVPRKSHGVPVLPFTDGAVDVYTAYKFVVTFENTLVPGYVTEKVMNAMLAGAIPIYWGGYEPVLGLNPRRFIHCNISHPSTWARPQAKACAKADSSKSGLCDLSPNSTVWQEGDEELLDAGAQQCLDAVQAMLDDPASVERALQEPIVVGDAPAWDIMSFSTSIQAVVESTSRGKSFARLFMGSH